MGFEQLSQAARCTNFGRNSDFPSSTLQVIRRTIATLAQKKGTR